VIAFDVFGEFPLPEETHIEGDIESREKFIKESGGNSISKEKLMDFFQKTNSNENVELVKGDVSETIPEYLNNNPQLKISLLNIDVDLYKPTFDCLKYLYDKVVKGGVIILDDYNGFPGATKAIDEFISDKTAIAIDIKKFSWPSSPSYIVKRHS
jgi:hypothetical protein